MLDFREHFTHITKDVNYLLRPSPSKRKLTSSLTTLSVEQLLKSKNYATNLRAFNERQLPTIDGILNKAMRQAIKLFLNFTTE